MFVHVVCPTCSPHNLLHALVMHVEPWEQMELTGWIDVTGQWLWADREDSIYVVMVQSWLQTALWHATQHQHLSICRGIFNTGIKQDEIHLFSALLYFTSTQVDTLTSCSQVQQCCQASIKLLGLKTFIKSKCFYSTFHLTFIWPSIINQSIKITHLSSRSLLNSLI